MNKFTRLIFISIVAALGGLLFGFDIAIITGAGPYLVKNFELNNIQEGWAYSSLLFGCILGAAVAGRITDAIGRKKILIMVAVLFAVTSVGSALAFSLNSLVVARMIGGIAVGAASTVSPMYISEVTPKRYRGSLVSMYQLFIVTGILISYLINYMLSDMGENNWRWMFATGAAPSLLFLITLFLVPETPRFLYKKGDRERALGVLEMVNSPEVSKQLIQEIDESLQDSSAGFRTLLDPSLRKVMLVGFGLAVFVQLSGINTIIDYAPKIFTTAGWKLDTGLFATFGLGIVNFIFTWVSILVIDKFGRRPLYLVGSAGQVLTLGCLSMLDFFGHFRGTAVLIIIVIYLAFFASCIGPVFWTYMSEIFPNRIRGTALSVPVFTQWIFNALVVLAFPLMLTRLQSSFTFLIIFAMAAGQLIFSMKYMRETKGKSLEEIEHLWE
jgi:SP family arabinose:H+ symporter-like MFS transporter